MGQNDKYALQLTKFISVQEHERKVNEVLQAEYERWGQIDKAKDALNDYSMFLVALVGIVSGHRGKDPTPLLETVATQLNAKFDAYDIEARRAGLATEIINANKEQRDLVVEGVKRWVAGQDGGAALRDALKFDASELINNLIIQRELLGGLGNKAKAYTEIIKNKGNELITRGGLSWNEATVSLTNWLRNLSVSERSDAHNEALKALLNYGNFYDPALPGYSRDALDKAKEYVRAIVRPRGKNRGR